MTSEARSKINFKTLARPGRRATVDLDCDTTVATATDAPFENTFGVTQKTPQHYSAREIAKRTTRSSSRPCLALPCTLHPAHDRATAGLVAIHIHTPFKSRHPTTIHPSTPHSIIKITNNPVAVAVAVTTTTDSVQLQTAQALDEKG